MRVYLASRYSRGPELQGVAARLDAAGHEVVCRWITHHDGALETSLTSEQLTADPKAAEKYALCDVQDLQTADAVVSFTDKAGGKGGRHVEFGMAWGLGLRLVVVGPRENVFHTLREVEHHATIEEFLEAWAA